MRVRELIERLQVLNPEAVVVIPDDPWATGDEMRRLEGVEVGVVDRAVGTEWGDDWAFLSEGVQRESFDAEEIALMTPAVALWPQEAQP